MKSEIARREKSFFVCRALAASTLCWLAAATSARSQSGVFTLNGGATTQSSEKYGATAADQSGVYVLNAGRLTLTSPTVTKSGDASSATRSDELGINAGVLATTRGSVTITGGSVATTAASASGLFATGYLSTVNMANGSVSTTGGDSTGVGVTYGGAVSLRDVNVSTQGSYSPALGMTFGGGTMTVIGGTIMASGSVSPAVYSEGNVAVSSATLIARAYSGAVIDGASSISLTNCLLTGVVDGIDIGQVVATSGNATFAASGGSLTALAGDLFFLSSSAGPLTADITLSNGATATAGTGNLVNATDNSTANLVLSGETLTGNLRTDTTSTVAATLTNNSALLGHINTVGNGRENLTIDAGSSWKVNGTSVLSSVTSAGSVAFKGDGLTVNVTGDYSQAATGKLLVVLGGTGGGANYDQLAIAGSAALAGTLEVNAATGFTPQFGKTFNIVTYGSRNGEFATLTSSTGVTYTVDYGAAETTITVTGAASTNKAPAITSQPQSIKANPGASVTFSVTASGQETLSYQWYDNGRRIQGATGASYTIADVTAAQAGNYDVVVTNSLGSVTSATAALTIRTSVAVLPVVTVAVFGDGEIVVGGEKGKALFSRTGSTSNDLTVYYQMKGTGINGSYYVGLDGEPLSGQFVIPAGEASAKLKIVATDNAEPSTVNVVLLTSSTADYTLGTSVKAKLQLVDAASSP
jgi:hypothetical protein